MKSSQLLFKNPQYLATEYQMGAYQLAYLNGELFRRSCRRKRPSEDATLYADLIGHTAAMPLARYVVDTINDVVFEPGVDREIQFASPTGTMLSADTQDWSELFQLDADLTNTSLNGVMENIGDLTSIFGFCWVFVDMPYNATAPSNNLRPYVCAVSPLNVWDWDFESVNGVNIPRYVKVLERETTECYYFKIYYLGTSKTPSYWESYEYEKTERQDVDIQPTATGQFPLGMSIPGFIAYTKRDPRRFELGISDIDIAADVQREVYKLECEAYQSIQFARTLIRADNGIKIPAQAGSIVRATQGQVEAISLDQQDVRVITEKQQNLLDSFQTLTGLGGLTKSSEQVQSGVSIIEERRQLHRMAKAKARLMEACEEQVWTFASRFMGVRWAGEVSYNTDYEQHDTRYRIALMEKAKMLLPENPIVNGLVLKEIIGMLAPEHEKAEYQQAIVSMQDPAIQVLESEEERELYTRDVGDQVPETEDETSKKEMEEHMGAPSLGTTTPGIVYTGQSFANANDAIAAQLGWGPIGGR